MALPITDLFTPAASGVSSSNQGAEPDTGTWLAQILDFASTLGLQTTAWQAGGEVRTILAIIATLRAQEDVLVSVMAQGAFLDYSATGTVTYVADNGTTVVQPVTPDPSIPEQNPTGALGWLDVLASSVYNVSRIAATYARGTIAIENTTATPYGPFVAGTYHVSNATTGAGYSNAASLTIAAQTLVGGTIQSATNASPITITTASAHGRSTGNVVAIRNVPGNTAANGIWSITVVSPTQFTLTGSTGNGVSSVGGTTNVCTTATFQADNVGPSGSATPRAITQATTTLIGVNVTNLATFFGQNWESNTALASRCRLKLQSLSPNGAAGAYKYFALTASQILSDRTPQVLLSGGAITRVLVQASPATGVVTVTVSNANGPVSGVSNLAVTNATNASPIVVTTTSAHGLSSGAFVTISGVLGNSNANGTFTITVVNGTSFSLDGTTGNATYIGGGVVQGGDLGQVDSIIQQYAVPSAITAITQSASTFAVTVQGTVYVPLGMVSTYQAAVQPLMSQFFQSLPIGGVQGGYLSFEDVVGVLYTAGSITGQQSYVVDMTGVLVNGTNSDAAYTSPTHVATLSVFSITVIGV